MSKFTDVCRAKSEYVRLMASAMEAYSHDDASGMKSCFALAFEQVRRVTSNQLVEDEARSPYVKISDFSKLWKHERAHESELVRQHVACDYAINKVLDGGVSKPFDGSPIVSRPRGWAEVEAGLEGTSGEHPRHLDRDEADDEPHRRVVRPDARHHRPPVAVNRRALAPEAAGRGVLEMRVVALR